MCYIRKCLKCPKIIIWIISAITLPISSSSSLWVRNSKWATISVLKNHAKGCGRGIARRQRGWRKPPPLPSYFFHDIYPCRTVIRNLTYWIWRTRVSPQLQTRSNLGPHLHQKYNVPRCTKICKKKLLQKKVLLLFISVADPQNQKIFFMKSKNYSPRVWKRIFLLKQKNSKYFCTGCPKSALRGSKTKFFEFFFIGASAMKSWKKSRIFRYRLPKDFLSKGQKTTGGGTLWIRGI